MAKHETTVDARDAFAGATMTVYVTFKRLWRIRLGMLLMRAACLVMGCGIRFMDAE